MSFDAAAITARLTTAPWVARVVIAAVKGSAPREVGAAMLVWSGGQSGTIGGGALEYDAAKRAMHGNFVQTIALGPALGQCCGGAVTLVCERFETVPAVGQTYVRRVTGDAPMPASMTWDHAVGDDLIFADGWISEPAARYRRPLWVYGAGHVGRALVGVLESLPEFAITWVDTDADRFPGDVGAATILPAAHPSDAAKHAPDNAHHLIFTYSHDMDFALCHALLSRPCGFIGLIGSATKWARFRKRLRDLGHDEAQINRISCPIGNPALGKHPQAIAVGVAAQLLSG